MTLHTVRLPDVGEGVAQAELVQWLVDVGDVVTSESALAEVVTDKTAIEICSPVAGTVTYLRGDPGDVLAVGTEFVGIEIDGDGPIPASGSGSELLAAEPASEVEEPTTPAAPVAPPAAPTPPPISIASRQRDAHRPLAAPAVRRAALERGVDLRLVRGSGPGGRILRVDLDAAVESHPAFAPAPPAPLAETTETKLRGVRRTIADRMNVSWRTPHITVVEEVDVTETEALRVGLNAERGDGTPLTILPFVARAVVRSCLDFPVMNSTYDDATGMLTTHSAVHVGIATQTDAGLVVPVVRSAERMTLWQLAAEISRLAAAARTKRAGRDDVTGSTITISSLGKLGGLVTTPILNHPEVAVVGVNKVEVRPVWQGGAFAPRTMMNLSSSFDHRVVDGWDAAVFVQRVKALLEQPARLFLDETRP